VTGLGAPHALLYLRIVDKEARPYRRSPSSDVEIGNVPTARLPRSAQKPKFGTDTGFYKELKRRIDQYFDTTARPRRGSVRMYFKTAVLLAWFGVSYGLLVFAATTWWQAVPLAASLALAIAGIGFAIQHDANHGSYSSKESVNRLMGLTLDLLGASSFVWKWKHNIFHHTYTNLSGADEDINIGFFARLSPVQRRRRIHRLQQFYIWLLYGFLLAKWQLVDDFKNVAQARVAENRIPRPRGWALVQFVAGKVAFAGWAFVVPMLLHPWWVVLLFYGATSFFVAVILSVVFQVAHCGAHASFPTLSEAGDVPNSWAIHEVESTVDFGRNSRFLTWYLGGLNYQIEHHLFPKISHVHYPRLAPIVEATCAEFGVRYTAHAGFLRAVSSHWRWLRKMGRRADQAHGGGAGRP
jgi:linoleoyl-CoA desaturase